MTINGDQASELVAESDYDAVGGGKAIAAVVDRFYELVTADEQLSGYFDGVSMPRLKRHQVALVSQVMGGPVEYSGRDLGVAHAPLGITEDHFGAVVVHLVTALTEAGVPSPIIDRVGAALAQTEPEIVATRG
ncbi:group 1 truncated hemoglobin [Agromyces intestinalis]|uniref:Group 1 truncated hemoglobin n=1 Tax=Agromyces intestinalis TaxID=2592652 RepID=A0A5C1YHA7_9MICO|nr:group 1 truncated hemoglobin [Agromyces intestinalis]QEO14427.1 group 1 truncated hemoglobin [Agromyces intestinalis]